MKLVKIYIVLLVAAALASSCNEFLDRGPSKNTLKPITTAEQLDALMATYATFYSEYNHTALAGDDFGLTAEIHDRQNGGMNITNLEYILWNDVCSSPGRLLWSGEYEKIYYANLVLSYIGSVSGDESLKRALTAEAHFLRAYSMFQLAVAYTLWYDGSNGSEPGLPLKQSVSFEESISRASLEQTWAFIEADLNEALKCDVPFISDGRRRVWRATRTGVNAFAARYHLYRNDMAAALKYASAALSDYDRLKDFNTQMSYSELYDEYTVNASTAPEVIRVNYPYTFDWDFRDLFDWEELLYARTCYYVSWWYIPSRSLLDCFAADAPDGKPENDLRYEYFVCEDYSLTFCDKDPAFRYPGYCQFSYDELISGPTVAEMLLIKAEAEARRGDWQTALNTIGPLRRARILASEYSDPAIGSQSEAVQFILRERRREMPFTMRWYDIKRLNANDDPSDDVTVTREFYAYTSSAVLSNDPVRTYTLAPGSRRFATPIPTVELDLAKGALEQNRY